MTRATLMLCGILMLAGAALAEEPLQLAGSGSSRRDEEPQPPPPPVAPRAAVKTERGAPAPGKYMVYTYGFGRQSYSGYFLLSSNGSYKAFPGGATGQWSGGGQGVLWTNGPYKDFLGTTTMRDGRYRIVLKKKGASDSVIATGPVK